MKRFKYSLENVLHYKEQILDSIKAEHGTLLAQIRKKEAEIQELLKKLTDLGAPTVVLTGVQYADGRHGAVAYDSQSNQYHAAFRKHIGGYFAHGTGDIFSSLLSGAIVKGASLEKAVSLAVNLTTDCIEATLPDKDTYWYGVSFESCMGKIAQEAAAL